jgi:hypothetical protein
MEADLNINEIAQLLDSSNPTHIEHWDRITRATGTYVSALFVSRQSSQNGSLALAGTGTLVAIGNSHFILTSTHVWDYVVKSGNLLGVSIREHLFHTCFIENDMIAAFPLPRPKDWNEWGPDAILLRLPPFSVGEIKAFKSFYALPAQEKSFSGVSHIEAYSLFGTPFVLGKFDQNLADVSIVAFQTAPPACQSHQGFDYLDVNIQLPSAVVGAKFGGVSGGSLWKVLIYSNPDTGEMDSYPILLGTAFYELDVQDGRGVVRCHGPKASEF